MDRTYQDAYANERAADDAQRRTAEWLAVDAARKQVREAEVALEATPERARWRQAKQALTRAHKDLAEGRIAG
jgi:hypothetical protein